MKKETGGYCTCGNDINSSAWFEDSVVNVAAWANVNVSHKYVYDIDEALCS